MLFPVIDIPQTNMQTSTINYMNLGVLTRNQLKQMSQRVDSTTTELQRDHAALTKKDNKHRLFHSYNMKSWRNVYTRRQWRLHIDNLYEAMLADQVYQDTLDIAEYEAVHALMHGR